MLKPPGSPSSEMSCQSRMKMRPTMASTPGSVALGELHVVTACASPCTGCCEHDFQRPEPAQMPAVTMSAMARIRRAHVILPVRADVAGGGAPGGSAPGPSG